jgi:NTP pyrophosphatase (non-canonical NTP hydrolase)
LETGGHVSQGKAGKYTEYSQHTGITKTNGQSTIHDDHVHETVPYQEPSFVDHAIPAIVERTRIFAVDRDWLQYHTPRNLALALMGEIGELAELFQFLGDDDTKPYSTEEQLDKIGQEIADITIYMCRLSDVCNISLPDAFRSLT